MASVPISELQKKGVYTIIINVDPGTWVKIGKLGKFKFAGVYAYTGSAIGTGTSSLNGRISRHLSRSKKAWWHVDYLLKHPDAEVEGIVSSLTLLKTKECEVSQKILESVEPFPIKGFGSSDCSCGSHLAYLANNLDRAFRTISEAHRKAGLEPRISIKPRSSRMLLFMKNRHIIHELYYL